MALIIEDGSIVANANSYVTVAEARTYATERGLTLSATDSVVEAQLIVAKDYLESLGDKYKGEKTDPENQSLQWPRKNVIIDGVELDENTIPQNLKDAQSRLAVEQEAGVDLFPTVDGNFIVRDKTGPLETTYSEKMMGKNVPTMTAVEMLLKPLLRTDSFYLRTVRV